MKIQDIKNIIRLANHLDNLGLYKEADSLDSIINSSIRKIAVVVPYMQSLLDAINSRDDVLPAASIYIYPISDQSNHALQINTKAESYYLYTATGEILINDNSVGDSPFVSGDVTPEEWLERYTNEFPLKFKNGQPFTTESALLSLENQYGAAIKAGGMKDKKLMANYKFIAEILSSNYGWDPLSSFGWDPKSTLPVGSSDTMYNAPYYPESELNPEEDISMQPEVTSIPQANVGCPDGFNPKDRKWIKIPGDSKYVYTRNQDGTFSAYSIRECGKKVSSSITVQQMRAAGASGPMFDLERPGVLLRGGEVVRDVTVRE